MIPDSKFEKFQELFVEKVYTLFLSLLKHCRIDSFLYNLIQLFECVQLFSYIYNSLFAFSSNSDGALRLFSDLTTYFRVSL